MPDSTGPPRFIKLGSTDVLLVAHASEDSRFLIVPVIDMDTPRIVGWRVYESMTGELLAPKVTKCRDGVWERFFWARTWVYTTYYGGEVR